MQIGLLAALFSGFLAFMSWLQISKFTFNEFDNVCKHVGYSDCMRWFWETKNYFQTVEIVSIVVLISSLILVWLNRKNNIL